MAKPRVGKRMPHLSEKIETNMRELKAGTLHSGSKTGPLVRSRKQAIAISYSQVRKGKY